MSTTRNLGISSLTEEQPSPRLDENTIAMIPIWATSEGLKTRSRVLSNNANTGNEYKINRGLKISPKTA